AQLDGPLVPRGRDAQAARHRGKIHRCVQPRTAWLTEKLMDKSQVIIASAKRTPIGAFQGVLSPATAPQLGAAAIRGALESAGVAGNEMQEDIMGCVLAAGLGQAPGR